MYMQRRLQPGRKLSTYREKRQDSIDFKVEELQRYLSARQGRAAMLKPGASLENTRTLNQHGIDRTDAPEDFDFTSTTSFNFQSLQSWLPPC